VTIAVSGRIFGYESDDVVLEGSQALPGFARDRQFDPRAAHRAAPARRTDWKLDQRAGPERVRNRCCRTQLDLPGEQTVTSCCALASQSLGCHSSGPARWSSFQICPACGCCTMGAAGRTDDLGRILVVGLRPFGTTSSLRIRRSAAHRDRHQRFTCGEAIFSWRGAARFRLPQPRARPSCANDGQNRYPPVRTSISVATPFPVGRQGLAQIPVVKEPVDAVVTWP